MGSSVCHTEGFYMAVRLTSSGFSNVLLKQSKFHVHSHLLHRDTLHSQTMHLYPSSCSLERWLTWAQQLIGPHTALVSPPCPALACAPTPELEVSSAPHSLPHQTVSSISFFIGGCMCVMRSLITSVFCPVCTLDVFLPFSSSS